MLNHNTNSYSNQTLSTRHHVKSINKGLHVKIGDDMQLQVLDNPSSSRFNVKVIGLNDGRSLIISAPLNNGNLLMLHEGQQFILRSLSGKLALAFSAEVMKIYMNPYPYVHLRVSSALELFNVRNANRIAVEMITLVQMHDIEGTDNTYPRSIATEIVDMSTSGCQIRSDVKLDVSNKSVNISMRLDVAGHVRTLKLPAEICSHRVIQADVNDAVHLYGLKFDNVEDDKRLIVNCFVYEKILDELYPN